MLSVSIDKLRFGTWNVRVSFQPEKNEKLPTKNAEVKNEFQMSC